MPLYTYTYKYIQYKNTCTITCIFNVKSVFFVLIYSLFIREVVLPNN